VAPIKSKVYLLKRTLLLHYVQGWMFNVLPWITSFVCQNIAGIFSDKMLQKGMYLQKKTIVIIR